MKIWVIGAGSIGLLFAGKLAMAGADVAIVTRTAQQADDIGQAGITVMDAGTNEAGHAACRAIAMEHTPAAVLNESPEWLLLTVKQKHVDAAFAQRIAALCRQDTKVVCFQNGVGHMERLSAFISEEQLYTAITTEAALKQSGHSVLHTGHGTTWLGNSASLLQKSEKILKNLLISAGFAVFLSNNINDRVYMKLVVNAVINPLTALWRIRNGELLQSERRIHMMRQLFDEAAEVVGKLGFPLPDGAWEEVLGVCRSTANNTSSMLRDIQEGRETEIDWINGSVISLADRVGVPVPANRTVFDLVKGILR